jgi:hypothetical protein
VPAGIENTPISADASFEHLPGLIEGLDDRIFHAEIVGARDKVAKDLRLRHGIRHGGVPV